jgi:hypothetical protein
MINNQALMCVLIGLAGHLPMRPAYSANALSYVETQTLRITNPGLIDDLGYSLDAGRGYLISGAINVKDPAGNDVGAAFVYRQDSNNYWVEDA